MSLAGLGSIRRGDAVMHAYRIGKPIKMEAALRILIEQRRGEF